MGHFRLQKIIFKRFTRYGNACILIESVHQLPRENTREVTKSHPEGDDNIKFSVD